DRVRVHGAADVVCVGNDSEDVDFHRDGEVVGDLKGALAGWDIEARGAEGNVHEAALRRLIGEVESEARAVGLGTAGGVIVNLQDEVGDTVKKVGDIVGVARGKRAGGPTAEAACGKETRGAEAGVTAAGVALAGC